ncbi:MAG: hypothetical protein FWC49_02800, partial [Proteobacteria bacterium]|nr:hypothetical protein [Pseudomonadota bacterium]
MKKCMCLAAVIVCGMFGRDCRAADCVQGETIRIWVAPQVIRANAPIRIMAVSTAGPIAGMSLTDPQGESTELTATAGTGGMPWRAAAE